MKRIAIVLATFCGLVFCLPACQDMAIQYYNMGIDAFENGDTTAAVEYFEKSLRERDNDPDAHFNLGVALYGIGDYDRALKELRIASEYMPSDPTVHFNIAEVYAAMGHFQAAATEYEYAIRLYPDFIEAHSALGKLMMDGGHYASAESRFYEALALNASHAETQLHMGWLYVKIEKYNEASHYFFRGLRKLPQSSYGRLGLAMSHQMRENYEEALNEYVKVYRMDNRNADALLGIGICQLHMGRIQQSETALNNSLEANPDNPQAHKVLGDLFLNQEKYAEAISNYRMAIQQQEDFADAHLGLGQTLEAAGQLPEAEDAFQRALFHDPDNAMVLYRLGQIYVQMFIEDRARSYFEMAMDKASGDIEMESTIRSARKSLSENIQDDQILHK